jgi:alpha-amylase/alpha-mannosidase (GH57 family)
MHQPDYRVAGRFQLPWVYLHALAGYTDMAAALEGEPAARAVVNFTPVLLDQLDDYARGGSSAGEIPAPRRAILCWTR